MDAERWAVLEPLVDQALDLPSGERTAFLDEACAGDAKTRADVQRMVRECERGASGLSRPAFERFAPLLRVREDGSLALPVSFAGYLDIEAVLGRGGAATVYRAQDRKHGRVVAVKVLRRTVAESLGPQRFLAEIRVTAELQHPNVVPLFDSGRSHGRLYFVMPFVDGETLRARLAREGTLPVKEVLRITREVASALDRAHANGIVHRDVKPENILIAARDGHVYVADFGIALALRRALNDRITQGGVLVGTPAYMSPEQADGDRPVDARADIYSLACVVREMLTGVRPDPAPSTRVSGRPPGHETSSEGAPPLPLAVRQCLTRAMAAAPEDRHATAGAFAYDLSQSCEGVLRRWVRRLSSFRQRP